ncbi:MAG: hypothetical protein DELT_03229 [Desulfovibrio sp.]
MDKVIEAAIYCEEKPYAYRYGEEWEAMALMIDGGHKTPQEAFEAWLMEHRSAVTEEKQ